MATKVEDDVREIIRLGHGWQDEYIAKRTELIQGGMKGAQAVKQAIKFIFECVETEKEDKAKAEREREQERNRKREAKKPKPADKPKEATRAEAVVENNYWIYSNMGNTGAVLLDAPSPAAFYHLKACQEDKAIQKSFYINYTKPAINKNAEEEAERFTDDGRKIITIVDRILKAREETVSV